MQRSNTRVSQPGSQSGLRRSAESHAAWLFVALVLGSITVICAVFLFFAAPIPEWFVVVGRWLPAITALIVIRATGLGGGALRWFALRPGGWRSLLVGSGATVATLLLAYALSAAVVAALGLAAPQPLSALGQVALMLLPAILIFSLSTFGEEAAWRGFLQRLLHGWGFWRASVTIAALWVLFHVPLHGTMAIQGTIPWVIALTSTLGLFPLGLFLSAVVVRFGSVWPAVFAHALPLTALNLLADADALSARTHWILATITASLVLSATYFFAPRPLRYAGPLDT